MRSVRSQKSPRDREFGGTLTSCVAWQMPRLKPKVTLSRNVATTRLMSMWRMSSLQSFSKPRRGRAFVVPPQDRRHRPRRETISTGTVLCHAERPYCLHQGPFAIRRDGGKHASMFGLSALPELIPLIPPHPHRG
jgi:hypothetical protein